MVSFLILGPGLRRAAIDWVHPRSPECCSELLFIEAYVSCLAGNGALLTTSSVGFSGLPCGSRFYFFAVLMKRNYDIRGQDSFLLYYGRVARARLVPVS